MRPSGFEPATCWFVAWCLNHYTTARPVLKVHKDLHVDVLKVHQDFRVDVVKVHKDFHVDVLKVHKDFIMWMF